MYLDLNNVQMFQINNDMVIGKWVLQVIFLTRPSYNIQPI